MGEFFDARDGGPLRLELRSVDGRDFLAQCQMSLNNPMWREIREGCLSSGLSLRPEFVQPTFDARLVDPHI